MKNQDQLNESHVAPVWFSVHAFNSYGPVLTIALSLLKDEIVVGWLDNSQLKQLCHDQINTKFSQADKTVDSCSEHLVSVTYSSTGVFLSC